MTKLKVYGCPFLKGGKFINPSMDLITKQRFEFYANYRYAVNLVSNKKMPQKNGYEKSTGDQWLNCFRRTVLFSDSTDLIPLKDRDIFTDLLIERAGNTRSLDHTTCWMNYRGNFFILTEPYVLDSNFDQLIKQNNLIYIKVP